MVEKNLKNSLEPDVSGLSGLALPRRKHERALFAEVDFTPLYGIGPVGSDRIRIGITRSLSKTFLEMQVDAWLPLRVKTLVWIQGYDLARRLKRDVGTRLRATGRHVLRDWYDLPEPLFSGLIRLEAARCGIRLYDHAAMLACLRELHERRITRSVEAC